MLFCSVLVNVQEKNKTNPKRQIQPIILVFRYQIFQFEQIIEAVHFFRQSLENCVVNNLMLLPENSMKIVKNNTSIFMRFFKYNLDK